MAWKTPYIVYRLDVDSKLLEVFCHDKLQKVQYWMKFIAEPGDILCRTPMHAKHSQKHDCPEYVSHKDKSGKPITDEPGWKALATARGFNFDFPVNQLTSM